MNIATLQHSAVNAEISITTRPGRQSIKQPQATLRLKQPAAEMDIRSTPGKLSIDQSQAFAEAGRKGIGQLAKEAAAKGKQKALEGTGRRAMEGRELTSNSQAIQQQATRLLTRSSEKGLTWIPSYGSVKIDYQAGDVTLNVQTHRVENHTRANKPIIHYEPGKVNIQVKQYPSIQFEVVNKTI